jgi:hypothetical protein
MLFLFYLHWANGSITPIVSLEIMELAASHLKFQTKKQQHATAIDATEIEICNLSHFRNLGTLAAVHMH